MSSQNILYDHTGQPRPLDQEFARGGEGTVHRVAGDPAVVAKVYRRPATAQTAEKLQWMVQRFSPDLRALAAWPLATLHVAPSGPIQGFLMPRFADALSVQKLYNPSQRKNAFPRADWQALIRAASTCAAAFAAVHAKGCVVGDVNQNNVLVSPQGTICLIDCDSFQVQAGSLLFRCEVGVAEFTPPELQGKSFADVVRTVNHDGFGLAVLIFHLLLMGRHPFLRVAEDPGEPEIKDLIQAFRFTYGRAATAAGVKLPANAPTLDVLSPELRDLFERAFARGSEVAGKRPTAVAWKAALDRFEAGLKPCSHRDAGHKVPAHREQCPWCALAPVLGGNYFAGVAAALADSVEFKIDQPRVARLWGRLGGIAALPTTYARAAVRPAQPIEPVPLSDEALSARTLVRVVGLIALVGPIAVAAGLLWKPLALFGVVVLLVFGVWWMVLQMTSAFGKERWHRTRNWKAARDALEAAEAECRQELERFGGASQRIREELAHLRDSWQGLPGTYAAELKRLEQNRERLSRDQFLQTQLIGDAKIPQIGKGRAQLLASYGIETAYDVEAERVRGVKGFGDKLVGNLLAWKQQVQSQFRFDPRTGVPKADLQGLALKYLQSQDGLGNEFDAAVKRLDLSTSQTGQKLRPLQARVEALAVRLMQAEADLSALSAA